MQHKTIGFDQCDVKFASDDTGEFEGYLSTFGNVDSYGDTVVKGAYAETLKGRKRLPPMLLNHDAWAVPIGIWKSMAEDDVGLRVTGQLTPGNSTSAQVYAAMKHGAMDGLSIGYKATKFEENDHGGLNLLKVDLREGSVVTMPAEDTARIDVVKFDDMIADIKSIKDFEYALRDVGCSQKLAKRLVSQFKDVCQRDVGELQTEIDRLKSELNRYQSAEARKSRLDNLEHLVTSSKRN